MTVPMFFTRIFVSLVCLSTSSLFSAAPPSFILTIGGPNTERVNDLAVDEAGNTYILGSFQGTVDFDPGPDTEEHTATSTDMFVASYTASGSLRFVIIVENPSGFDTHVEGSAIAVDAAGNFYVTGIFEGTIDFDPGTETQTRTSNGFKNVFVAHYSPTGALQYVLSFGASQGGYSGSIVVDGAGNVYITGAILSVSGESVDFDPGPNSAERTPDGYDSYLVSYDVNGDFRFVTTFGGPGIHSNAYATAVALGGAGVVYLVGYFDGTVDFDPGSSSETRVSNGESDAFVARYNDTNGSFISVFAFGGEDDIFVRDLALTGAGSLYAIGSFDGTVDFDPGPESETRTGGSGSTFDSHTFLASYGPDGTLHFVNTWDVGNGDLATDRAGNSFLTGYFGDTVDFDPGPDIVERTPTGEDTFIASYSTGGDFRSLATFEGGSNRGVGIGLDGVGNGYVTGVFYKTVDFDPGEDVDERVGNGYGDIFLVSLPKIGAPAPVLNTLYLPQIQR